jgi:hypothetical protein
MTIEYIENTAEELDLEGADQDMYEELLDEARGHAHRTVLFNRMYIAVAAVFFMCVMITIAVYFLSLEYEVDVPGGLGLAMALLAIICFPFYLVLHFYVQKLRALQRVAEAKVLGYLGQFM